MVVHYPRYAAAKVQEALLDTPVVFIMGARQSGKTTLAKHCTDDRWKYVNLDDQGLLNTVSLDPIGFIRQHEKEPLIIDEIQRLPELLLAIKQSVDENRVPGRFLLTGSANALVLPRVMDSLAGRIECVHLNTLSECEIRGVTPGFFDALFSGQAPQFSETRIRDELIQRIVSGCYPEPLLRQSEHRAASWYTQYVQSLIQKDIHDLTHIQHRDQLGKLLSLTAHYSGQLLNLTEMSNKCDLTRETVGKYIQLLEHLFLIDTLPAWHSNQAKRLIKTPKMHVCDTGLMCAIQGITVDRLSKEIDLLGHVLETFAVSELRKQVGWRQELLRFYHYRDKDQVEVDCIIETLSGDCFAIEIKAGATLSPKSAHGLKRFQSIAGDRFKMGLVLYDGDHLVPLSDDIYAVPLSSLWT